MKLRFWRRETAADAPTHAEVEAMLRDLRRDKEKLDRYEANFNTNPAGTGGGVWGDGSGAFPL